MDTPDILPPESPAGILALFQRFADLADKGLADRGDGRTSAELQEYVRLRQDIPEHLRRLLAFADLGTDALLERAGHRKP